MDMETKLKFFQLLVKIGFKEIEVGFPAASETEYDFLRALIERNMIPDDVTVQVLTQAREHIIRKTFEALKGCRNAIVHVYNSTSKAQRDQVFRKSKEEIKQKSKEEIKQIAVEGAKLLQNLTDEAGEKYRFEYSPESFTGTEPEYALEVCNAVLDVWKPTPDRKAIMRMLCFLFIRTMTAGPVWQTRSWANLRVRTGLRGQSSETESVPETWTS